MERRDNGSDPGQQGAEHFYDKRRILRATPKEGQIGKHEDGCCDDSPNHQQP